MNIPSTVALPAYPLNQYMLLIKPSNPLEQRIRRLKNEIRDAFHLKASQMQGGYILLARFTQYALLESRLADKLRLIAMGFKPFRLELSDYYSHPDHVVGIRIANPAGIQLLQKELRQDQRLLQVPGQTPYFNQYPAISLASRLQPEQYGEIWKKYKNKHLHAQFIADSMVLLRKKEGSPNWLVVEEMAFRNLPVMSKQGVLFA